MTLLSGSRLGPYEIVAPLGTGGMSEVYRARDTRLKRDVALKVLTGAATGDSDRFKRFQTEAEATAALSHPHIVAVYDVGRENGTSYIVSELMPGGAIGPVLNRGPLPIRKLLDLAIPIADALAAAHERGIVHRDLKPDNILLSSDGSPKIADFGLAKYFRPAHDPDGSRLTTLSGHGTGQGAILGTLGYMSPEQARGARVDFRSDQFSLGCILYEMATGRRAFRKPSTVQTLAAIVEEEPEPILQIAPGVPAPLRWVIERCLAKDPNGRYASTRDLAEELSNIRRHLAELGASNGSAVPARIRRPSRIGLLVPALVLLLAAVIAAAYLRRADRLPSPIRSSLLLPENTDSSSAVALSPDGRRVAFVATRLLRPGTLWIRTLDSPEAQPIAAPGQASFPFWSPDSRFVGFFSDGKLRRVEVSSGAVQTICDAEPGLGGTWSPDGTILFAPNGTSPLYRVPESGGQPVAVTRLNAPRHESAHRYPFFLPDGRHFLYMTARLDSKDDPANTIRVASLDGKLDRAVVPAASNAAYASGHLLYVREGILLAQPFDLRRLETTGAPVSVAPKLPHGTWYNFYPFSSTDRLLIFRPFVPRPSTLLWYDRSGRSQGALGEPDFFQSLRFSPDGRRLAVRVENSDPHASDIWIYDVSNGARSRFVHEASDPVWSPGGDRILFSSESRTGRSKSALSVKPIDGRPEEFLPVANGDADPEDWSPDGRFISLVTLAPQGKRNFQLWAMNLAGEPKATPLATDGPVQGASRFSPDGRWIAYASDRSGALEVYVRSFPGPGAEWQVSTAGGWDPRWRRDGKELYYLSLDDKVMAVPIRLNPTFQAGSPAPLFSVTAVAAWPSAFDVTGDGQRFLVNTPLAPDASLPFTLLVDWTALLKG